MSGVFGIRREDDHWRCFGDHGDYPGWFEDAEAARWGSWATMEDCRRINGVEDRNITMDDIRECIRVRSTPAQTASGVEG